MSLTRQEGPVEPKNGTKFQHKACEQQKFWTYVRQAHFERNLQAFWPIFENKGLKMQINFLSNRMSWVSIHIEGL